VIIRLWRKRTDGQQMVTCGYVIRLGDGINYVVRYGEVSEDKGETNGGDEEEEADEQ
jgi:hypothetical protein